MIDPEQVTRLQRRLKRAWAPFFTRFGRLTQVQIETIPKILDGANVVVASPHCFGEDRGSCCTGRRAIYSRWDLTD